LQLRGFWRKPTEEKQTNRQSYERLTHAYVHWLVDVHSGSFAPAFTLSFHDSECSRKPPMPIASVVMPKEAKGILNTLVLRKLEYEKSNILGSRK